MRLELGSRVDCTDERYGKLADIVIDPTSRRVTHVVVEGDRDPTLGQEQLPQLRRPTGGDAVNGVGQRPDHRPPIVAPGQPAGVDEVQPQLDEQKGVPVGLPSEEVDGGLQVAADAVTGGRLDEIGDLLGVESPEPDPVHSRSRPTP